MFSFVNRFFDMDRYLEKNHIKSLNEFSKNEILLLYKFALNQNIKANISEVYVLAENVDLAKKAMQQLQLKGLVLTQNDFDKGDGIYINSLLDWTDAQLEEISMFASKKPIFINFYRSLEEAGQIDKIYGKSPARVLEDFGFLDRQCYLIGCNYMEKDELEVMARSNVKIVLTPICDMLIGNGAVNLLPYINSGLEVLLGTASSPSFNLQHEKILAKGNTANLLHMAINDERIEFELETNDFYLESSFDEIEVLKLIMGERK